MSSEVAKVKNMKMTHSKAKEIIAKCDDLDLILDAADFLDKNPALKRNKKSKLTLEKVLLEAYEQM